MFACFFCLSPTASRLCEFQVPRPIAMTPQTPSNEGVRPGHGVHDADAILAALTSFTSLYSSSTIGMLAIGGLVCVSLLFVNELL